VPDKRAWVAGGVAVLNFSSFLVCFVIVRSDSTPERRYLGLSSIMRLHDGRVQLPDTTAVQPKTSR
jgi:hypothetical protein